MGEFGTHRPGRHDPAVPRSKARAKLVEANPHGVSRIDQWDMGEFGTRKVVIFRDPDGVFLELIERPPYAIETTPPFRSPY